MGMDRKKTYALLKTSWTYQAQEYFDNSTLHGVRYINEEGRPFCEKFMWFCFTSVGGVVTLIIIVSLWEKFQTNPTITGLDTDFHNWDVPFPTVTLCPENPTDETLVEAYVERNWSVVSDKRKEYYRSFLKNIGSISYKNLNEFKQYATDNNLQDVNFREILNEVVYKCESFITDCFFKAQSASCCTIFKPLLTEIGFCYSFNSMYAGPLTGKTTSGKEFHLELIHETDAKWSLVMKINNAQEGDEKTVNNKIRVYLHTARDLPIVGVSPQHIWDQKIMKMSFGSKETYTIEAARALSIRQRRCVFDDEIKLFTSDVYSFRNCMIQCRMKLAKKLCKCVPFFYKEIEGYKYCITKDFVCLGNNKDKFLHPKDCHCELGCSNTVYEVEKLIGGEDNELSNQLEIGFVSWPMVRYKREVLFGWVDLLVSFGGIAGLFLGFSLLSGVEIMYYFTMRALCMVYRDKEELRKLQEEYEKAEKPPLDLRLTPIFMRKDKKQPLNIPHRLHRLVPAISARMEPTPVLRARMEPTPVLPQTPKLERLAIPDPRNTVLTRRNSLNVAKQKYSSFEFLP